MTDKTPEQEETQPPESPQQSDAQAAQEPPHVTRERRRRLKRLSVNKLIPNMMTLGAVAAGMSAIRFAFLERWEHAALAIAIAAILDGLDGRVARMLKGASKFGAELDSLSDFVAFGVAPAMVLYLWAFEDFNRMGWAVALAYTLCCGLRLARFNTALEDPNEPPWASQYFLGVPSPAGAGLVMLPMLLHFQTDVDFFRSPAVVVVFLLGVAALLVCPLRTFSFKRVRIARRFILPVMLVVGGLLATLFASPWFALTAILVAYLISLPFGQRAYSAQMARWEAAHEVATEEASKEPNKA
ncbi:MAG: CDP-diacylglycerol--serine O-phosphatidyltransferase [Magnetovibrionaceae bacterium]